MRTGSLPEKGEKEARKFLTSGGHALYQEGMKKGRKTKICVYLIWRVKKIVLQATQIKEYLIEQGRNRYRINYFGIRGLAFFNCKARVLPSMGTCYADQRAMKMAAVLSSDPGSRALLGPLQWKTLPNSGCTGLLLAHIRASLDHIPRLPLGLEFCALRASPPPGLHSWCAQTLGGQHRAVSNAYVWSSDRGVHSCAFGALHGVAWSCDWEEKGGDPVLQILGVGLITPESENWGKGRSDSQRNRSVSSSRCSKSHPLHRQFLVGTELARAVQVLRRSFEVGILNNCGPREGLQCAASIEDWILDVTAVIIVPEWDEHRKPFLTCIWLRPFPTR